MRRGNKLKKGTLGWNPCFPAKSQIPFRFRTNVSNQSPNSQSRIPVFTGNPVPNPNPRGACKIKPSDILWVFPHIVCPYRAKNPTGYPLTSTGGKTRYPPDIRPPDGFSVTSRAHLSPWPCFWDPTEEKVSQKKNHFLSLFSSF